MEGCEPEHLCVPILSAYQTKHLFYRAYPAAKNNVIPPRCNELLHTTPKTTFHSSTSSPSARNTPQPRFGFYQNRTGRSLRTGVRKQRGLQMISFEYRTTVVSAVSARVGVSAPLCDKNQRNKLFKRRPHSVRRPASLRYVSTRPLKRQTGAEIIGQPASVARVF